MRTLASVAIVLAALVVSVASGTTSSAATSCTGKHVYPGANLVSVAAAAPAGTTFCIHQGTYPVSQAVIVQDYDRFVGVYQDPPRPTVTTTSAQKIFDAEGSDRAIIRGLRIQGAVGSQSCQPDCGRGISRGAYLTVDDVRLTNNKNQGIGGQWNGLLITNSEIDHNGSSAFAQQTGGETAAGVKSAHSMTIRNSYIHDNYWAGVWCDDNCGALRVEYSTLTGNGKAGIHTEISIGPQVIRNNTIKGNGYFQSWSKEAGLLITSVRDVEVYGNTFGNNRNYGIWIAEDSRWPVTGDVSVHDNIKSGDLLTGCSLTGVTCYNNR